MIRELNVARNDTTGKSLKTVEGLLVDLRETWGQAIDINRQQKEDVAALLDQGQKSHSAKAYAALNAAG